MLDEYALIPDIFDPTAYSRPGLAEICLPHLREPLMKEAIVRDLAGGAWQRFLGAPPFTPHRLCIELLKNLASANRLRPFQRCGAADPVDVPTWCREALAAHAVEAVTAIIATHASVAAQRGSEITDIEKITSAPWWANRSPSKTMVRSLANYQQVLSPILRHANSVMFIDPNLDPTSRNYRDFSQILSLASGRRPSLRIEIHRSLCEGDGPGRTFPIETEWKRRFNGLAAQARQSGIHLEVYGWDDFHDRYLIADIIGLHVGAGFDTTTNPRDSTTWGRLGRKDLDHFSAHFHPAKRPADLRWRLTWP